MKIIKETSTGKKQQQQQQQQHNGMNMRFKDDRTKDDIMHA